jgi:hypothetical protein
MNIRKSGLWPAVAVGMLLAATSATAVFAATPSVSYTSTGSTPGSTLSMSGTGFGASEQVNLSFGLSTATVTSSAAGSFSGTALTVPNVPAGLYYIVAVGQSTGSVAFTSIWINGFFPLASPSGWYVPPGSTITFSGSSFPPNDTITVRDGSNTNLGSFQANSSGSFSGMGSVVVPFSARNSTITYTLTGVSGASFSFAISVADLYPYALPSTWYAAPGTPVTFGAGGFGAGETVNVFLGASTTVLTTGTADSAGNMLTTGSVTLPFGSIANYRLVGVQSGAVATAPITLAGLYPSLNPSTYYSAPGGMFTLNGSGFAGGEAVNVWVGSATSSVTANSMGAWTLEAQAPATPNTGALVKATGTLSSATASYTMAVGSFYPSVTPSTWYSFPGDAITFSGSGFAPNETVAVSGAHTGTVTANSTGAFTGLSAVLPAGTSAIYNFLGSLSNAPFQLVITLGQRFSAIWFDNYYDEGGSALTIYGAGFGGNEQVELSRGGTVFTTATAGSDGTFAHVTTIPYGMPGDLTISARGLTTGSTGSATLTVAPVYTDLQLQSYAGSPGTNVTFLGHGYLPNESIEVRTDRTGSTVVHTMTADSSGSFNSSYAIPAGTTEGNWVLTVKGLNSYDEKQITFYVTP